jgi:hypothetical protein
MSRLLKFGMILKCVNLSFSLFWKSVLLGAGVSHDREEWSVDAALRLCHYLMVDNTRALNKVP